MKLISSIILFFLLNSSGCAPTGSTSSGTKITTFAVEKIYRRSIFESEADCKEWQNQHPITNCYQLAKFSPDGRVFVVLTDMPNTGTYMVDQDKIHIVWTINSDAPPNLTFSIFPDGKKIMNEIDGHIWVFKE